MLLSTKCSSMVQISLILCLVHFYDIFFICMSEGYMVLPKSNRCVMFDAQYLHGVIPGRGVNSSPHSNARRLTFMVGFWKDIAAKDRGNVPV